MSSSLINIRIDVSEKIYQKDPNTSDLGRAIIKESLPLIDELGLERFTFRKLANTIGTTESAVYRYFENKHKLLLYYVSWYWGFLEYHLAFGTANISDPKERLQTAIRIVLCTEISETPVPFDLEILRKVMISESSKAYLTKEIDKENKTGLFVQFKSLTARLAGIFSEIAPGFPYCKTLASLLIESNIGQLFFMEHIPSVTDLNSDKQQRINFFTHLAYSTLDQWQE